MLGDSSGLLEAVLTPWTAEQLLQVPACQFAVHTKFMQDQVTLSIFNQQFLFGMSYLNGQFQVDAVSPVA